MPKIPTGSFGGSIQGRPAIGGVESMITTKTEMVLSRVKAESERTRRDINDSINLRDDIYELNTQSDIGNATKAIVSDYNNNGTFANAEDYQKQIDDTYDNIDYTLYSDPLRAEKVKAEMEIKRQAALTGLSIASKQKEMLAMQGATANKLENDKADILRASSKEEAEAMLTSMVETAKDAGGKGFINDETIDGLGDFLNNWQSESIKFAIDSGDMVRANDLFAKYEADLKSKGQYKDIRDVIESENSRATKQANIENGKRQEKNLKEALGLILNGEDINVAQINMMQANGDISDSQRSSLVRVFKDMQTDEFGSGDLATKFDIDVEISKLKLMQKEDSGKQLSREQALAMSDKLLSRIANNKTMSRGEKSSLLSKLATFQAGQELDPLESKKSTLTKKFIDNIKFMSKVITTKATLPIPLGVVAQAIEDRIMATKTEKEAEEVYEQGRLEVAKIMHPELENAKEVPAIIYDGVNQKSTGGSLVNAVPDKIVNDDSMIVLRSKDGEIRSVPKSAYNKLNPNQKSLFEVVK